MTQEQALAKIAEWGPDATARKIVALDFILQAQPLVMLPETITLLDGRDLVLAHDPKWITVDVSPYLHYTILLDDKRIAGFVPKPNVWSVVVSVVVSALVVMTAEETLPLGPGLKQLSAVGIGSAAGLLTYLFLPK
jgi:hypothetical protein